jgi:DNA-3-methyladenine glycosylase
VRTRSEPDPSHVASLRSIQATTLPRSFYERPVERVARALLGSLLVRVDGDEILGGRIVETEAYGGPGDPGSHADRAPNGRARIMFGPAGIAYVYFTYGMHHCINAVTGAEGTGSAVLIRALEPMFGVDRMRVGAPENLPGHKVASGPGRVCRALGITRELNGSDLTTGEIRILKGTRPKHVDSGVRIGLTLDDRREWRYWTDSPSVSSRLIRTTA